MPPAAAGGNVVGGISGVEGRRLLACGALPRSRAAAWNRSAERQRAGHRRRSRPHRSPTILDLWMLFAPKTSGSDRLLPGDTYREFVSSDCSRIWPVRVGAAAGRFGGLFDPLYLGYAGYKSSWLASLADFVF
jgi:hypothetical protein